MNTQVARTKRWMQDLWREDKCSTALMQIEIKSTTDRTHFNFTAHKIEKLSEICLKRNITTVVSYDFPCLSLSLSLLFSPPFFLCESIVLDAQFCTRYVTGNTDYLSFSRISAIISNNAY